MKITAMFELFDRFSAPADKASAAMNKAEAAARRLQAAMNQEMNARGQTELAGQKLELVTDAYNRQRHAVQALERAHTAAASAPDYAANRDKHLAKTTTALEKAKAKELEMALAVERAGAALEKQERAASTASGKTRDLARAAEETQAKALVMENGVGKGNRAIDETPGKADKAAQGLKRLLKTFLSLKAIKVGVSFVLGSAAEMAQQKAQMEALLGDAGARLFDRYQTRAVSTGFQQSDYMAAVSALSEVTEREAELTRVISQAERAAAKRGGSMESYADALRALYSGDFTMAKRTLGFTAAEVETLKAAKSVEALDAAVEKALQRMGATDTLVAKMGNTVAAKWDNLKEKVKSGFAKTGQAVMQKLEPILERLHAWLDTDTANRFFAAVGNGIAMAAGLAGRLLDGVIGIGKWVSKNWKIIEPILIALATVHLVRIIGQLWAMIPPLLVKFVIWAVMNWQILLVVAAVLALVKVMNLLGVTTEDVFGTIGGVFGTVFASVYNVFANVVNVLITLAEALGSLDDPISSVMRLLVGLADCVLGLVKALSFLSACTIQPEGALGQIQGWRDDMNRWVVDKYGEPTRKFGRLPTLDELETMREWEAGGRAIGRDIENALDLQGTFTDATAGIRDAFGGAEDQLKGLNDIFSGAGSGGGKVRMDEPLEVSSEDLKVMRDLAEREAIQYFVTLQPNVSVSGNEFTNKTDMDAEEMVELLSRRISEETEAAASGVFELQPT